MKKIKIIVALFTLLFTATGQTNLDSLYRIWEDDTLDDSTRVMAYADYIYDGFLHSQPDTTLILAEELLAYGLNKNYPRAQAVGYQIQSMIWGRRNNYTKSITYSTKSLKIYQQIGDQYGIAGCLHSIGLNYTYQGDVLSHQKSKNS